MNPCTAALLCTFVVNIGLFAGELNVHRRPRINADLLDGLDSTAFWKVHGNAETRPGHNFLGTLDNQPLELHVNRQRALRLEPTPGGVPNIIGGSDRNFVDAGVVGATISGGGSAGSSNRVAASHGTVGGGGGNLSAGPGGGTVGGGLGNMSDGFCATIGGGNRNRIINAWQTTIGGGEANTVNAWWATIGGGFSSFASGEYATVGGGNQNFARGRVATVGGGYINVCDGEYATIAGGVGNQSTAMGATVGGGELNKSHGTNSTVAGGVFNSSSGYAATVGGGSFNISTNDFATVPGGLANLARGAFSFAAGRQAQALHDGTFVWADSSGPPPDEGTIPFPSVALNEFAARATGGVRFVSAVDPSGTPAAGVRLAPGSGAWENLSDRNAKDNFVAVNAQDVLEKVASLPLTTWNYKSQDKSIRHLGPTAQDFQKAFGLGGNERTISTVDADGVALAAVQGLNQKLEQLRAENGELKKRLVQLEEILLKLASKH